MLETRPDPTRISLRIPLIPRRRRVFVARVEPLAHVERSLIRP